MKLGLHKVDGLTIRDALHKLDKELSNRTSIFEDLKNFKDGAMTECRSLNRQKLETQLHHAPEQKPVEYWSSWSGYAIICVSLRGT